VGEYLIRRAMRADAEQIGEHLNRILQAPTTKMCTANMQVENKTLVQQLEDPDAYWNILVDDRAVKAVASCARWHSDQAWLFCSVESPFLFRDGFRHCGGSLAELLVGHAIAWAKTQPWIIKMVACAQENNSGSVRLLRHFEFERDGHCPANDCPRRADCQYQFWVLTGWAVT